MRHAEYHGGALAVQRRAGLEERATALLAGVRTNLPEVAAAFLAAQSMIVVAATDGAGRTWTSALTAGPGFLRAPDPRTLTIDALPRPDDPLAAILRAPTRVGLIALDPTVRRRIRLGGTSRPAGQGLMVDLDEAFSNCPKYIQRRERLPEAATRTPDTRRGSALTATQRETIARADTFFIGTAADGRTDASHRGGNPGFVTTPSPTALRWPDYEGNAMFLTLGNLALRPSAGLLFPSWETGSTLQLTGTATTVWDATPGPSATGRWIELHIEEVRETTDATPLRWTAPELSRHNPPTP